MNTQPNISADNNLPEQASQASLPVVARQSAFHNYLAFLKGHSVVAAVMLLTLIFSILTALVLRADLLPTSWDIGITHEIQELPYMPVGAVLVVVSAPGFQPWNWIMAGALVALFIFVLRRPVDGLFVALAGASGLLAEAAKMLVDRPRPTPEFANVIGHLTSYSFPSGHTTTYTALFGFLFYLAYIHLPRRAPVRWLVLGLCAALIVLVGPSRVYMGQHWASDAMAGYALGFAYLLLLIQAYRLWLKRDAKRKEFPA